MALELGSQIAFARASAHPHRISVPVNPHEAARQGSRAPATPESAREHGNEPQSVPALAYVSGSLTHTAQQRPDRARQRPTRLPVPLPGLSTRASALPTPRCAPPSSRCAPTAMRTAISLSALRHPVREHGIQTRVPPAARQCRKDGKQRRLLLAIDDIAVEHFVHRANGADRLLRIDGRDAARIGGTSDSRSPAARTTSDFGDESRAGHLGVRRDTAAGFASGS